MLWMKKFIGYSIILQWFFELQKSSRAENCKNNIHNIIVREDDNGILDKS